MFRHFSTFRRHPAAAATICPPPRRGWAVPGVLVVLAIALLAAMFLAPLPLAGVNDAQWPRLSAGVGDAFVQYWASGRGSLPPPLTEMVAYWRRFHAIKAAIASVLLVVSVTLTVVLWQRFLRRGDTRTTARVARPLAGSVTTVLVVLSTLVLVANVQGAAAPLSSVLTLLPAGGNTELRTARGQVIRQLTDYSTSGHAVPPLAAMVDDFADYHVVLAVVAGAVVCACLCVGLTTWRALATFGAPKRRTRVVRRGAAALSALLGVAAAVVCVGNITVAIHPAPALLGFFQGGW